MFTRFGYELMEVYYLEVGVLFLQALNHFQRYAYVRQAHAKEQQEQWHQHQQHAQYAENARSMASTMNARSHSNSVVSNQLNGAY